MIRSGCSSANFRVMASCSFASLNAATERGFPASIALSARSLLVHPITGNIMQIPRAVGETEDMHLMLCREMADLIVGGDLVPPIRRERDALAYKENSHQ